MTKTKTSKRNNKQNMSSSIVSEETATIRARYQYALNEMIKISEVISTRLKLLDEKEARWKETEMKMKKHAEAASTKIKLDVGGKIFATTKANILNAEGTYFHGMLSSGEWQPDEDGAYFIDANPKHFDRILDYLRTGEMNFTGLQPHQIERLKKSLNYFQIKLPVPHLTWDSACCGIQLSLSEDKFTVTKTGSSGWNAGVLGSAPCDRFSVRIDHIGSACNLMIGFSSKQNFQINGQNYTRCGWYLYGSNGNLYSQAGDGSRSYHNTELAVGNVLTVIYNKEKKEISYEKDGTPLGVAFTSVASNGEEIYPALDTYDQHLKVTLIQ